MIDNDQLQRYQKMFGEVKNTDDYVSAISGMTFNFFQVKAKETAIYPNQGKNLVYPVLGLLGESGEVAEKLKKCIRDSNGVLSDDKREEFIKELCDVVWYLAAICNELGIEMNTLAEKNLIKLFDRKKRGVLGGSGDNR